MRKTPQTAAAAVAVGLALLVSACGSDATSNSATESAASTKESAPSASTESAKEDSGSMSTMSNQSSADTMTGDTMTGDTMTGAASPAKIPTKIVSMSASATEMLYAIEAQDQVIAVDNTSNYPPETADKMVGLDAYTPSIEAITALTPDLVVNDGSNPDLLKSLDEVGIAHWEGPAPANFDDIYTQIEQLGALTGHVGPAAELVGQMQTDIDKIIADAPQPEAPLSFYHELDDTYYSVTSDSFIGFMYDQLGLKNIADADTAATSPYPQLNAEFIVQQNPDIIFLADTTYGVTVDSVKARPGWDTIAAVTDGNIFPVDADLSSRWGPRVVDFMQQTSDQIKQAAGATTGG